ncbi:MAG: amidohydrolase [Oscillospiraceae bacterium]|nr:amidohydrolase [Bacteroidaceae bacterium]MBQ5866753.1 amidohydrolase [Oscillospiraceae bacterium]
MSLLDVKPYDSWFYEEHLKDFLPDTFIDCHTHIWLDEQNHFCEDDANRSCAWPNMVAHDNSVEDLNETNRLLFPDKKVISVLYGQPMITIDLKKNNAYVAQSANKYNFPALYISHPSQSAESVERAVLSNPCFKGLKVYLQFAPSYIPNNEIRIYDFLPHEHLALADKHGWVVQIHIARPKRLADPVNYVQLLEIEQKYPNIKLIVAHLGRAYSNEDLGDALDYLKNSERSIWDFTANTNQFVMEKVLDLYGADRFIYGTDFPIFRMKARRTVENGFYINEIPVNSLGDVSSDPHMREIAYPEADKISFFIYEEILSCKNACKTLGLGKAEVQKIFYDNSAKIFDVK